MAVCVAQKSQRNKVVTSRHDAFVGVADSLAEAKAAFGRRGSVRFLKNSGRDMLNVSLTAYDPSATFAADRSMLSSL
jgi:hypothetical protein